MQKNTLMAVVLSSLLIFVWMGMQQPKKQAQQQPAAPVAAQQADMKQSGGIDKLSQPAIPEKEVTVETAKYRAVFTSRGGAIKHWFLKEKSGKEIDLVLAGSFQQLSTFPGSDYVISQPDQHTVVFNHTSPLGWKITKTFSLSDEYMHGLRVELSKTKKDALIPSIQLDWGPGLGTDAKEEKENATLTRVLGYTAERPYKLEKFKTGDHQAANYQWTAIDNRYFLVAFIPEKSNDFESVSVYRSDKKHPLGITLTAAAPKDAESIKFSTKLFIGPKELHSLASYDISLDQAVDFGWFGFLGKYALKTLHFFHNMTGNYGWAIILLTICIQIIVLPLTIKSFKASAAMKQLQPLIKQLQEKYKDDPRRLNVEMLNLYKSQKVNPLGGCLPMLLQLPIFWALFTTLRNAFELRGAPWILWVHDLSGPDALMSLGFININLLPLIMGIGMFFQQKMMSAATDPMQQKMMYLMPVMFTFMFWGFPSGLVLYWLTNSIVTMIEQYIINEQMTRAQQSTTGGAAHG